MNLNNVIYNDIVDTLTGRSIAALIYKDTRELLPQEAHSFIDRLVVFFCPAENFDTIMKERQTQRKISRHFKVMDKNELVGG